MTTAPRQYPTHTVYTRQFWSGEWTARPHLYCDRFTLVAGPDIAEATLSYNYGIVQPVESMQSAKRDPLDINGHWVRVELSQGLNDDDEEEFKYWYGRIVNISTQRHGTVTVGVTTAPTGKQILHCRGLEYELHRKELRTSVVEEADGGEKIIGRAIAFNLGPGRDNNASRHGNRSADKGDYDSYIFASKLPVERLSTTASMWSAQDIIEYLFYNQPPWNNNTDDQLHWTVADGGDAEILNALRPMIQAEGKSIKQVIDEIIDRRRLIGYTIDVVGDDERPKLNLFTFNTEEVILPGESADGGKTVPANSSQTTWYFDNDPQILSSQLVEDEATHFHRVIARGAPLTATVTIGDGHDDSLVIDWDDTLQDGYDAGATGASGYSSLIAYDKQAANQMFRAEHKFYKVYKAFVLNPEFDGTISGETVCPDPDDDGDSASEFWWAGLRLLDRLPLVTDVDYTTVTTTDGASLTIDKSQPTYLPPFAFTELDGVNFRLDRPGIGKLSVDVLASGGRNWAASLTMQDSVPGVLIDVSGAPQHVIAKNTFTPADDDDTADFQAEIDWTDIEITVCIEFDQHAEAKWPEEELDTTDDIIHELFIEVPYCRLDYLVPDTVIGIDDEGAVINTDGGYVRDDRPLLKDIARSAYEWYGQTRKALTVVKHSLICEQVIGELITEIGTEDDPVEVNSVVTKIEFDLLAGTTTVSTQYANLDFARPA